MAQRTRSRIRSLPELMPALLDTPGFADVLQALESGQSGAIGGAWGSCCALVAATLCSRATNSILIVVPRIRDVDEFAEDISAFLKIQPLVFPAWETLPDEHSVGDAIFGGRLRVLNELADGSGSRVIVTSLPALMQPVPNREERRQATRRLQVGDEIDLDEFLRWLHERGFERVTAIECAGEFSVHGGIVDVFPPAAEDPLRLEFFGDEIESIRRFDVVSQRKLEELSAAELTLVVPVRVSESDASSSAERRTVSMQRLMQGESLLDSLPGDSWVILSELLELVAEGRHYLDRLSDPRGLYNVEAVLSGCTDFPSVSVAAIGADSTETTCHLQVESIERFSGGRTTVLEELAQVIGRDERVLIACHNEGELSRLGDLLRETPPDQYGYALVDRVELCLGQLQRGFRLVSHRTIVIGDHELFGRAEVVRHANRRQRTDSRAIDSFLDLNEGDFIVHLTNGIGRYRGMKLLEKDDQVEEHLELEFRDAVRVYVPVSLIHLVQKYVGAAKGAPLLSKLGTTSWSKKKQKVADAISDMASDMLRMHAAREAKPGIASNPDTHLQQEFETAFPWTETPDQLQAAVDIKADMERTRPMDRLICGDVGYGKTEVAMRAAFKCIDNGRQVAVLVPTTVLAEQHYRSFCQRMAEFPINIEVLSRFRTKAEQKEVLAKMAIGSVDLVIGTHRLVQKDIRFRNLGLLVTDEEQRFGVAAKDMLKQLRLEIDVLTLTATPIPRTLHMSLLGIRDISNLVTPPLERQPISTRVCRFDGELIRNAIVRELNRGGQVYFVHNRVYNIEDIADRLSTIVPEATIAIAHGQMGENSLEAAMTDFVKGRADILVATTIIESGLDIPNANTMFIHDAGIYGLADLHQLRGRVGRQHHRAYCYLLLPDDKPVTPVAAKRLKAIEEYSELGAGFKIAMRDLEIRGAGNILGTEQSGHISAVGYELYCQLLENSVRHLKGEPPREQPHVAIDLPLSAFLPNEFVPAGRAKIEIYRRLSSVGSVEELREFSVELRDRFGPLPEPAECMLRIRELQILASLWQINDIHVEDGYAVFGYRNPQRIRLLAGHHGSRLRIVDQRLTYWPLDSDPDDGESLYEELHEILAVGDAVAVPT